MPPPTPARHIHSHQPCPCATSVRYTAVTGAKALDPAKSVEAVNQLATAASQGADNGMWFAKEGAPIPAVEGAKKRIADLRQRLE